MYNLPWPPPRLHHSGLGAVPADADRGADRRQAGSGLSGSARSARARGRDALSADAARLPAGARPLPRRARDRGGAILPRIVAVGDVDEDEIAFAEAATGAIATEALDLPPPLGGLERRLLLAQLVLKWASGIAPDKKGEAPLVANNPAAALALADDLARLIDDMTTRAVPWERLDGLVPDNLDRYWQLTLEFLKIARETWPAMLAERGPIEPAARRDALIKAEAERLPRTPTGR